MTTPQRFIGWADRGRVTHDVAAELPDQRVVRRTDQHGPSNPTSASVVGSSEAVADARIDVFGRRQALRQNADG